MKKLLLLLILFVVSPRIGMNIEANNAIASICNVIKKGVRYLFIGDSITDGGWGRSGGNMMPTEQRNKKDLNHIYGHSYMMLCAARIQSDYPELETQFFNRGISGNTLHAFINKSLCGFRLSAGMPICCFMYIDTMGEIIPTDTFAVSRARSNSGSLY